MTALRNCRRALLVLGAALLVTGGVIAETAPSTAATAHSGTAGRCVTLDLIDQISKFYANEPLTSPTDLPMGFKSAWFDQITGTDGTSLTADSVGTTDVIAKDPTTGTTIEYMTELVQFSSGTIRYSGAYNRADAIAQHWITDSATGVSGSYLGMSGTVRWRIISLTTPSIPVEAHVVLCPRLAG